MERRFEVSVVILTYFHEEYIEQAIKSVLCQETDFDYEIIISDDHSEDRTLDIVQQFQEKFPDIIRIIQHKTNVGTTKNLYNALLAAKGRYITLLSGDDYYCNNRKLVIQRSYLETHPECFAVAITMESVFTDGELVGDKLPSDQYRGRDFPLEDFIRGINYPIHGIMIRNRFDEMIVRRTFHRSVEFSKYIEDLSLCILMYDFGKIHVLPDVAYRVTIRRGTEDNQHNFNTTYKGIRSAIMHVELMVRLQKYYGRRLDLSNRLAMPSWRIFCYAIKSRKLSFLKYLRGVPLICLVKGSHKWIVMKVRNAIS